MSVKDSIGPLNGPDRVIRDDLDRIVRACDGEMGKLSGSSLLLTGATGFVGRYLVESVIRFNEIGGAAPCIVTLPTRHPELLKVRYPTQVEANEVVVVEWGERHAIDLPGRRWDYVVHGAATADPRRFMQDPGGSLRDTVSMAASIADIAKAADAKRLVLISSGAVYGDQPGNLTEIPETFRGGPDISALTAGYGEAKRVSELLFRMSGLDQRVARVFSVLGPYQDLASSFAVPDLIHQAAEHGVLRLTTDGSARRSYCYATDLTVFVVKLLLGDARHDVYNVGCREGTASVAEVAQAVADIFGGLEVRRAWAAPSQRNYVPQLDRLYEIYAPQVGLREGLLRTCHSLYARGLIDRRPVVDLESREFRS
jgi:nucleoside-diphosphate-sugar epimerase